MQHTLFEAVLYRTCVDKNAFPSLPLCSSGVDLLALTSLSYDDYLKGYIEIMEKRGLIQEHQAWQNRGDSKELAVAGRQSPMPAEFFSIVLKNPRPIESFFSSLSSYPYPFWQLTSTRRDPSHSPLFGPLLSAAKKQNGAWVEVAEEEWDALDKAIRDQNREVAHERIANINNSSDFCDVYLEESEIHESWRTKRFKLSLLCDEAPCNNELFLEIRKPKGSLAMSWEVEQRYFPIEVFIRHSGKLDDYYKALSTRADLLLEGILREEKMELGPLIQQVGRLRYLLAWACSEHHSVNPFVSELETAIYNKFGFSIFKGDARLSLTVELEVYPREKPVLVSELHRSNLEFIAFISEAQFLQVYENLIRKTLLNLSK